MVRDNDYPSAYILCYFLLRMAQKNIQQIEIPFIANIELYEHSVDNYL